MKLRVAIATSGRFHVLDLARELDALGVRVDFYSYVSRRRAKRFGLPPRCHVGLLSFVFPFVAFERIFPRVFPELIEWLLCWSLDLLTIVRMRRCDVFICMSGIYKYAPRFARWRYGARVILHRGSRHILSQKKILASEASVNPITDFIVRRELDGYHMTDRIAVPSSQVAESFAEWPELAAKLFISPYGVDLEQFPLRSAPSDLEPTLLFVGHWSYRKGVDILTTAVKGMADVKLIHVGAVLDASFPEDDLRFVHHDPVPQWELSRFYARAHVFVLASREEGLAMVQCQALASGLRLVCSDRTGGADLATFPGMAGSVWVVPVGDVDALRRALAEALARATGADVDAETSPGWREMLSWHRYAVQHLELIYQMLKASNCEREIMGSRAR